ncbi:MAG: peptidase U32 family protein [Longicatena sp.]
MIDFITTPFTIGDIAKLKAARSSSVVIATHFFSARGAAYFKIEELPLIKEECKRLEINMYVLVNRFFVEEELPALRQHLRTLKELDVDGIYYGDEGVYYEARKLGMVERLIYNPDTLITNAKDAQYYLDEGIKMVTLAKEITLEELCFIGNEIKGECEVVIHGRLNMMHSKRNLLTNYVDFIGKKEDLKNNYHLYISEETREEHMPIIEDELGTHVFTGFTLSSFDELLDLANANIHHFRIDGIFHDIDYVIEMLTYYQEILAHVRNGRETYEMVKEKYKDENISHGFYYKKTSSVK